MRERDRKLARMKLDREMQPFRRAGQTKQPTNALLRAVRESLGISGEELAARLGVLRSSVYALEKTEARKTITLRSLDRAAEAMGCKVVYGIVPEKGKTLERLAEERLWRALLAAERAEEDGGSAERTERGESRRRKEEKEQRHGRSRTAEAGGGQSGEAERKEALADADGESSERRPAEREAAGDAGRREKADGEDGSLRLGKAGGKVGE